MKIIYWLLLIGLLQSGCTISRATITANKDANFNDPLTRIFIEIEGNHKVNKLSKDLGNKLTAAFRNRKVEAEAFVREPLALEDQAAVILSKQASMGAAYKMTITLEDYSQHREHGAIYGGKRNIPYTIKTKKSQWILTLQETESGKNIWKAIVYISNNNISGSQMTKRIIERLEKDELFPL